MKDRAAAVSLLLFMTLATMTLLPLGGVFYFLEQTLETNYNLTFNQQVRAALQTATTNLKTLKKLDAANEPHYRQQFEALQTLNLVYQDPNQLRSSLMRTHRFYFGIGAISVLLLSLFVAILISRKVANEYKTLFSNWQQQSQRIQVLQELNRWQEFAKVLAHEIKNPLTPIEVLVTSMVRAHEMKSFAEFKAHLLESQKMIQEELFHLKSIVNRFSEFSRLPQLVRSKIAIPEFLAESMDLIKRHFPDLKMDCSFLGTVPNGTLHVDQTLMRQVFINLIKNGIQANPGQPVAFALNVRYLPKWEKLTMDLSNSGTPVPSSLVNHLFEPYVSSHHHSDNMGLGLAIAKKIMIEHEGDIEYAEIRAQPHFILSLPLEVKDDR